MPLFFSLTTAALFMSLQAGAPRVATPQVEAKVAVEQDAPRVEIGPAVLTLYGPNGEVVSVE